MGRRKHHVQLSLAKVERKPDRNGQWRGGKRDGAGRKRASTRPCVPHVRRPYVGGETPLHITLRVEREVGWLRKLKAYAAISERIVPLPVSCQPAIRLVMESRERLRP